MISQLLINTLTGAGTGYITNNIAIKMLFKKYFGRFGGMIEDTHDEFVQNISKLIEKDLINHSTLADEFQSDAFRKYITQLIEDMFESSLINHSYKLADIRGVKKTKDNLFLFLDETKQHRKNIKQTLLQVPLEDIVSQAQLLHFCKALSKTLHTQKSMYAANIMAPLKSFTPKNLITEEIFDLLSQNIKQIFYDIDFKEYDKSINKSVDALLSSIDITKLLKLTKSELENLHIKEFFKEPDKVIQNLIEFFINIAVSDKGKDAIYESVHAILEHIQQIESSILDLVDDNLKTSIREFIQRELPVMIEKIVEFMDKNEKELEVLINSAIDKALTKGVFGGLKKRIVSIFYTNIVQDFKILNQAKAFIHENREKAQEEITAQILDILEHKSIGELYNFVSEKNIITPQKITDLVVRNLSQLQSDKKYHLVEVTLNKQLKELTNVDLGFVQERLIPHSFEYFKKEYLYKNEFKDRLFEETSKIIDTFKSQTLEDLLSKRLDTLSQSIISQLDNDTILDKLLSNANKILPQPMNELIDMNDININYPKYINEFIANKSIKDIVVQMQSQEVYLALESALVKVVVDNLEAILEGNVSEAVKHELQKLPPSQIKEMVEEFMGDELKPINYFGAALGGITGASIGMASIPTLANPLIYAIVGVATNYLAIKMLFRPFTPFKIANFKIPLTQGVLPSNKPKMAIKMSEFVDEFMLNGTSIEDFFTHNSNHLKSFIKEHLSKDNYTIIDTLLKQDSNTKDLSHEVITLIFNFLDKNETLIAEKIFNIFSSLYDSREMYKEETSEFLFNQAMQVDLSHFFYTLFDEHIEYEKSLSFIADEILQELDKFRDSKFDSFLDLLKSSQKLRKILLSFEPKFAELTEQNSLSTLLPSSVKQTVAHKINSSMAHLFYGHGTINELLNFFTKGEFTPQTKLSDMINGRLPEIIQNNLTLIINESVLPALKENKKTIRSEILKKLPLGSGLFAKRDINRTIDIILSQEIPQFIDKKIEEINLVAQEVLDTKIVDLGYNDSLINQKKVDDLIIAILSNTNFTHSLENNMSLFIDLFFEMKLQELLKLLGIVKLVDIYDLFEKNIETILIQLHKNSCNNKEEILSIINTLSKKEILLPLLKNLTLRDLLNGINKEVLLREFQYLLQNLRNSQGFTNALKVSLDSFLALFMKEDFLDKQVFKGDLDVFLKSTLKNKENLRGVLLPFLTLLLEKLNTILDIKLKDHTVEILIDAAFESITNNITELINAVDFKKVITKEIEEMHPKELEDMFYSFAGAYFNKLILYGSLGFFFGLVTLIEL